ncbi:hypothetical protein MRB53_009865 [Persea americana]|uniref:Uncharacterized protein n=1 Tax=Persea americana TaxID=3435 RepID=A0ACC2LQZ2_PERAE|nr:hypothetical protein MRB53_009865 [Persea americana]
MSCEFCQVQGTFWLRNESPNHAHSKLHTEGSHCSSFSLSSSRTGVTRGRVSPCHLFPSSFAFPLGEMPNEGRRRMKIKVCLRVFKNLCLISVFVVLTTEPCKSSPSHHSLFVRCGEVTNSSF